MDKLNPGDRVEVIAPLGIKARAQGVDFTGLRTTVRHCLFNKKGRIVYTLEGTNSWLFTRETLLKIPDNPAQYDKGSWDELTQLLGFDIREGMHHG